MGVEEAFKKVLGKKYTDEKVKELINNLSDDKSRTNIDYLEYLNLLEPLNISTNKKLIFKEDTDSVVNNNGKNHVVTNNVNQAGQGTYGTTYRAKTKGLVFKKIVFPGDDDKYPFNFNMFCRNTFVESFIQTILSCDESPYSNNICKIVKMYKDSPKLRDNNTVLKLTNVKSDINFKKLSELITECRGTIKFISKLVGKSTTHYIQLTDWGAKQVVDEINGSFTSKLFYGGKSGKKSEFKEICGENATIEVSSDINPLIDVVLYYTTRDEVTFYIQLEPLTGSLLSELEDDYKKKRGEVLYHDLYTKYIEPLAKLLQYYNNKYTFYHNDSHGNNVMFKNNELKLIDFGMSCIKYKDNLYSNYEKTKKSCKSTDLGIFIVWLLQYANKYLLLDTFNKVEGLINIDNVVSTLSSNREKNKFYLMYTWMEYFKPDNPFYTSILKITPDFILNAGNKHNVKEKCKMLLEACNDNKVGEALRLIDGGADLNCVNTNGMTPLILASESDKLDVVAARLIIKRANLDIIDEYKRSALMTACIFKRGVTAMLLINAGANVKLKDNGNNTALEYAKISNLNDVKEAIEKKLEDAGKGGGKTRRAKRRNRTRKA